MGWRIFLGTMVRSEVGSGGYISIRVARCLAIAALVFTSVVQPARPISADSVDDYIRAQMARRKIPGVALAVVQRRQVVKLAGYGMASVELEAPVTPDTVFELASVTKQFTAAAIMKLVEEGKVGLEESVAKYLPGTPPTWNAIAIRHLLTHCRAAEARRGFRCAVEGRRPDELHDRAGVRRGDQGRNVVRSGRWVAI